MKKKSAPSGIFSSFQDSFLSSWSVRTTALVWVVSLPLIFSPIAEGAPPTAATIVGDTVTNVVTGADTTVTELILDPPAAPGDPALAFVRTADGHVILVRNQVNDVIYSNDPTPIAFVVVATDATAKTVTLRLQSDPDAPTAEFSYAPTNTVYQAEFNSAGTPGDITPPVIVNAADGVRDVRTGNGGSNGRAGALFVPPTSGGNGATGPTVILTSNLNISATTKYGIEAGSIGGKGGNGGDSYLSFWSGRDGGDGGAGGTVNVINATGIQVATSGANLHGIYAYSRSGAAGNGGSGFAAPGGGTGGHSSNGGSVSITNNGNVITTGSGAFGIYGLSVSGNGGTGGDQWGLVGQSGSGGFGGSGGPVSITNNGTIQTSGTLAHGILGQSIGGSGGSAGTSGNLLLSLIGGADNGGNAGTVSISNTGGITTTGSDSRGIFAQSVGGGGGSGGSAGGLIAIGGAGSNGGSGSTVTVTNSALGIINTSGLRSDGIFAQSVGGSGGAGSGAAGLVAIGGTGSRAGSGGVVSVTNLGSISTTQNWARGIVVQSIGGGGGDGGSSGGMVAVGGSGGGGGSSSAVNVTQGGSIITLGHDARGILAQSVGGGGGNGGSAGSVSAFVGVAIGGNAAQGGAGGPVNLTLQGRSPLLASVIRTTGDRSTGIMAQSVGGGGGTGGGAVQVTGGAFGAASIAIGGNGGAGGAGGRVTMTKGAGVSIVETGGNDSTGVFLESVGGGGGDGGYSVSVAASAGPVSGSFSLSMGGDGAIGGTGGEVLVGSFDSLGKLVSTGFAGSVLTTGDRSAGFLAQSVGGGGGNGGSAIAAAGSASLFFDMSVAVSLGGSGAGGGAGGKVSVGTEGNITTQKSFSTGMLVQSVGGGGGNGGSSIAGTISGSAGGAGAISVGVGGSAGTGSTGGSVSAATRSGKITTGGEFSSGIIAQSIGGGGGNGGLTVAAAAAGGGLGAGNITVGVGGAGGGGGAGGQVFADLVSDVETSGVGSVGVLIQSVGGGGGNSGLTVSAGLSGAGVGSGGVNIGVGASGGLGGDGDIVNASYSGDLITRNDFSTGLLAQSIGGGGGNSGGTIAAGLNGAGVGSGSVAVGIGGAGGIAGNGGRAGTPIAVTLTTTGTVLTEGDFSSGIIAQSIGGGGGNGGYSIAASLAGAGVGAGAVSVGIGGKAGNGGDGMGVFSRLSSNIWTMGTDSTGVLVQSVGGGGGNGGFNVSGALSGAGIGSGGIAVGLGGGGGSGGLGGTIDVASTGTIYTKLDRSAAFVAQSIGGGGGNGGFNVAGSLSGAGVGSGAVSVGLGGNGGTGNNASSVLALTSGAIETHGQQSGGVLAQSIGGGGGNGGFNVAAGGSGAGTGSGSVSVGLGGSGAGAGNGGTVNLTVNNTVFTAGNQSTAVTGQSIGGGGGNGGFNISAAGSGAGVGSGTVGVGLGGSGGSAGDGGAVVVTTTADIHTRGISSGGILAQSVGGGGGNGGFNVTVSGSGAGTGSGAVAVGLGGSGAGGGNASTVNLTVTNDVTTEEKDSTGILAQSVGGGGGNGAFDVTVAGSGAGTGSGAVGVSLGGSGEGGGFGSAVTSSVTGDIITLGDNSTGLLVQSLGGGGGNGGFSVAAAISGAGTGSGTVGVGIGGSGGAGGLSGKVISVYLGDVTTGGKDATGIIAQSIGGGGGNGGLTVGGAISGAGTGSGSVSVAIGGSGGGGGKAETVNNTVTGNIIASKSGSGGVLAQSLGGGGGNGGISVSGSISMSGEGTGAVGVGIGGSGGLGGAADKVTNILTGTVFTSGSEGFGVAAQSIGGGGGNGGLNVTGAIGLAKTGAGAIGVGVGGMGGKGGDAGDVDNTVTGYVQTLGNNATGILAQSAGGGGGNGGLNVTGVITGAKTGSGGLAIGVGGFGGDGGEGKNVINTVTGGVVTTGNNSGGIVAQSFGGGGGSGGINVSGAINFTKENGGAVGIGVGGFGGDGGNSGDVTSTIATTALYNQIGTTGDNSSAVVAQSIGGSGGNGALNVTGVVNLTGKDGAAVGVGVGGFGGGAGNSGNVLVGVTGTIATQGNNSDGILAQSIGGGGGSGGTNISGSLAITSASGGSGKTLAASIGVGGFGGTGGTAGNVGVTYDGSITAQPRVWIPEFTDPLTGAITPAHFEFKEGTGSHGLAAQSIGGGGGDGGINVSGGIAYASGQGDAYGLIVGIGGFGGGGGSAGDVNVGVTGGGSISSYGSSHSGIFAQSLGGGGGNGAINVSGGIVSDSPLIFGIGGFGADAGIAKNVVVNSVTNVFASATIAAEGIDPAAGILAQSLGGGGGNGGLNVSGGLAISKEDSVPSLTIGIGGFGGAGAVSGNVTVDQTGNVTSAGNWVHGILAQSIAGGGGNGGMNVSGQINFADSDSSGGKKDITIVAGVGGSGGTGANAGNVSITHNGIVTTKGDNALGVAAQSLGGGGGNGGLNVTGVFAKRSSPISVGVGGTGSGGGHAGNVIVNRGGILTPTGKITTDGDGATALEASSIGGGGGNAGMNFIAGISLAGADNTDAGFAANIAIGGSGGEAGNGGTAAVNNYSDIETQQKNSHGILAQSIGGGGGNGNFNLAVTYAGKNKDNLGFNLAVGGAPGDGGTGAKVDVVQVGNIETHGDKSFGILAQSIGGGGGNVGLDFAYTKQDGGKAGITIGRNGGIGGSGSDVTLSSKGSVITHGEGSFGMLAQSIGNGGGNSSSTTVAVETSDSDENPANSINVSIGLDGGVGGRAGNVTLDAEGWVSTDGNNAHAIFAQSVGGGGGNGGSANTLGLTANTAALSIGGTGGTGGVSGIINVTSSAGVRTFGDDSVGILAQSIGGGGGTGGMARTGGLKSKVDGVTVSVGGSGGAGMSSDEVTVTNSGVIITDGEGSHGVLAQSLGGGGGNSGLSINAVLKDAAKEASNRLAINVGGSGGAGAISGDVTVTNTGGIGTNKAGSIGILAQSIGGGGGNAKNVITSTVSGDGGGNNLSFAIGGSGGTGAAAGNVSVSNLLGLTADSGQIITVGNYSHGIYAMSIGGGGGTGSTNYTTKKAAASTSTTTTNSLAFNLGGAGGDGGTGGNVGVTNGGKITTYGFKAHGILAQSIGGGGGEGGMSLIGDLALGKKTTDSDTNNALSVAIGGLGGSGNKSGDVTVTNTGSIEVTGVSAYGIYAQSVGGGGGDGGFAGVLSRNILTNPKTDLKKSLMNIGIGGNGGDGADSGNVLVTNTGSIISNGDNSYGIFAQSVGGGGGNVGHSLSSPAWTAADLVFSSLLGARDGSNGTAGTVTINTTGDIVMNGKNSTAQFGQSVNGGGGNLDLFLDVSKQAVALGDDGFELPDNGGDVDKVFAFIEKGITLGTEFLTAGAGAAVEATHVGDLYTSAKNSTASFIQSIGGGGGNANSEVVVDTNATVDLELALGGSNSSTTGGGDVTITRDGDVFTTGNQSQGVGVQSIGGGGGNATVIVRKIPAPATAASSLAATAPAVGGAKSNAVLGGVTSIGSDGGNVTLSYKGDVATGGARAPGLIVQSIGGGGGKLNLTGLDSLDIALGGKGGTTGDGGDILLSNEGSFLTKGRLANGVILQSVGGGGGLALTNTVPENIKLTLNNSNTGNGGNITFDQKGDIVVNGKGSIAVLAQSLGGGGGLVDRLFANTAGGRGVSGNITLNLDGDVLADGREGTAVFAQSRAKDGQGDIFVSLTAGNILYAGKDGEGLRISGGTDNRFVNRGSVMTADGLHGRAAVGGGGNDRIDNFGIFLGEVRLAAGINSFVNQSKALFVPGPKLMLGGADSFLINHGSIRPGDTDFAQRSKMSGSFIQSSKGETHAELDFGSDVLDGISMTGTAALDGKMLVSLLNPQLVKAGDFQKSLFSADMGVTDDGMALITAPSVVINYELTYPTGFDAMLDYTVDFSPPGGLGRNLREVGNYFNRIQNAGSSPALADTVTTLLFTPTMDEYRALLSQLGPDFYGEHQAEMLRGTQNFGQTLADGGEFRFFEQDKLIWFNFETASTTHSAYNDYKSVSHDAESVALGFQKSFNEDWIAGLGFGYDNNSADGYGGRWNSEGETYHFGAVARHQWGATEFVGTLSYSRNETDTQRTGQVTTAFETDLNRKLETFAANFRVSHDFKMNDAYFRPTLDLGLARLLSDSATESGAGATNLILEDYNENYAWVRPALRAGNIHSFGSGMKLHLYAEIGYQYHLTDDTDAVARFQGAPDGVSPMEVPIDLGSYFHGSVGVQLINSKNVSLGVEYGKVFDDDYDLDRWNLRLNVPF
jgi:hypothetical protein